MGVSAAGASPSSASTSICINDVLKMYHQIMSSDDLQMTPAAKHAELLAASRSLSRMSRATHAQFTDGRSSVLGAAQMWFLKNALQKYFNAASECQVAHMFQTLHLTREVMQAYALDLDTPFLLGTPRVVL